MDQTPTDAPDENILVIDAPERQRFEISVDGELVGFAEYVDATADAGGARRTFTHTEIDEAYGGRGLATVLIRTALDSARARDLEVVPECPAVRRFVAKHADYLDLVPDDARSELGL